MVLLEKLKDEIEIVPTSKEQVEPFILKHYLETWPVGIKQIYGIRRKSDKSMIGMAIYGNPMQSATKIAEPEVEPSQSLELKRLYIEPTPNLPHIESYVISQTLKDIKQRFPDVKIVITFADPSVGHLGGIYQATNALYLGKSRTGKHKYAYILRGNLKALHQLLQSKPYPKN